MWNARYWATRFWNARYWAKVGLDPTDVPPIWNIDLEVVTAIDKELTVVTATDIELKAV